jgi:purine-binding chemotaxis protein CheW
VIDLCTRLGIPSGARDEKSRILVVTVGDEDAGILVDRVRGVVRIHPEAIRPVPETIERGAECLRGIARKEDKLYILLDIEKTLGA